MRLSRTLLLSVVLLLVFGVAAIAIVVFSRRFRAYLLRGKVQSPTQVEDIWSMHRLPEGAMDDVEGVDDDGDRDEDEADDGTDDEYR